VRDLGYADVGVRQHRLGGLDVVVREAYDFEQIVW
jgi:hypothetical protein